MHLGLETFSYHLAFGRGKMDIFGFIARTHELGLDGVQINVSTGAPGWGHLGSADPGHLRDVRNRIEDLGLYVELDTQKTDPNHLRSVLEVCHALGADVLRTYAKPEDGLEQAVHDLRQILDVCADTGIRIAFENHEHETSAQILDVVRQVDSDRVGILVDTGNSMMVWEDPVSAVRALAPGAVSSHFKDHVVILEDGEPRVAGITLGTGTMDCAECFRILANESPLERLNIEVCYDYRAPFRRPQAQGAGARLGEGAFKIQEPPYDPAWIAPSSHLRSTAEDQQMPTWQDRAVVESVAYVKNLNKK